MSTSSRILKNTGFLYIKMAVTMFISLYTTRLILNSLGVSDFGLFNVVGGAIAMMGFVSASMTSATQRFMSYSEGEGDKNKQLAIFNISIILHLILGVIVLLVLVASAFIFFNGVLNIEAGREKAALVVYCSMVFSSVFTIMTVPYDAVLNAHENMLYYSLIGLLESLLKLCVAFACVYTTYDKLSVYGILMALVPITSLVIMRIYCHATYPECSINIKKYWNGKLMRQMISFAGWNFFSTFAGVVSGYGSNIVLNYFFGTKVNAANGICGQLNGQLQVFSNNLIKALSPVLVKSEASDDRSKMYKFAFTGCKLTVCMYACLAIPFIVNIDYILQLWLKNVPAYTAVFCEVALLRVFVDQMNVPINTCISAIGDIKKVSLVNSCTQLLCLAVTIGGFCLGCPPRFFLDVAFVRAIIQLSYSLWYCWKKGDMDIVFFLKDVLAKIIVTIVSSYLLLALFNSFFAIEENLSSLVVSVIVSFMMFMVIFFVFCLNHAEKMVVRTILLNVISKIKK